MTDRLNWTKCMCFGVAISTYLLWIPLQAQAQAPSTPVVEQTTTKPGNANSKTPVPNTTVPQANQAAKPPVGGKPPVKTPVVKPTAVEASYLKKIVALDPAPRDSRIAGCQRNRVFARNSDAIYLETERPEFRTYLFFEIDTNQG